MLFNFSFEGNLAEAPELRFTPSGKAVAKMRVGHNTRRRNTAGEWVNGPTMWVTVTVWEDLAERVAEHLRTGDTVIVDCRDDLSVWAYHNQHTDKPAGQLQVTASNVALSMRFNAATAIDATNTTASGNFDDPWQTDPALAGALEPAL
ncbi:single-stranded DNA-binding protein [Dactylosporangium sp. NPDC000521]|uniref:single-stranded DNA-binding protein n=1 Tax=Dactylosporangium sp. NPDC000521 TaxID=3363975 RepID=UPI00368B9D47